MLEKLKKNVFNYFSNGPKAAFLLTLVVIALITTIYSMRKTLVVVIDGKENNVITYKRTVQGALNDNDIVLGEKDKIEPSLDSQIGKNDIINIKRAVNVAVAVDDKVIDILTAEDSVESMLEAEGITVGEDDKVLPSRETAINDGLQVDVVRVEAKTFVETEEIGFTTVVK
ncbi:MAG: ubiquitin-like domain-containing protein, partial [Clostridium sp.]|nr:ubiquitin-like domain-containing protein [Clostridium sp.]